MASLAVCRNCITSFFLLRAEEKVKCLSAITKFSVNKLLTEKIFKSNNIYTPYSLA